MTSGQPAIDARTLAGQVAIVTGGGRGIGRSIASELARAGAAVAVAARSADEVAETVALIRAAGGRALGLTVDVTDRAAVEGMTTAVEEQLGPVSLLVNNAATLAVIGPLWEADPERWRLDIEVTLFGTFYCSRAVLPRMIERTAGRIVNISSMNAVWGLLYSSSYDCAKTAQLRLTEGLAGETREHGITVFALGPGPVRTRMSEITAEPSASRWMSTRGFDFDVERDTIAPERAGERVVHLATGYADALSGRFMTVQDDLAELVAAAERIQDDDLLTLRVEALRGRIRTGKRTA